MMFIDVHCHLDMLKDIEKVIERAEAEDIKKIISAGVDKKTNRKVLELSKKFDSVGACLGIYPDDALKMNDEAIEEEIDFIRKNKNQIIAIGEVGMDFKNGREQENKQRAVFEKFVNLSKELDKLIVVHSRKAEIECIEILEKLKAKKVIMHYFSGDMTLVERVIKNGWMLSIPTAVKNNQHFQEVIKRTPINQILCETDSPFSHPYRKFPNEPVNVIESYKMIVKIKNKDMDSVEKALEENFEKLIRFIS